MGEFDEVFMLGAIADNKERAIGGKAGLDSKINAFPGDLATRDNERAFGKGRLGGWWMASEWLASDGGR